MKKTSIYPYLIAFFIIAIGAVGIKYYLKKNNSKEYSILPRKGAAANTKEFMAVQQKAEEFLKALKEDPNDTKTALRLAALFLQEARETGNIQYYDQAAMKYVNLVLEQEPNNFNALVYRAVIYLSQHHFVEGLNAAQLAKKVNPDNAYVYGLLVDAHVELGNYDSAVVYADKMVSIRPDLTSYSRISYVREIFGDYPGAIKAMKMAVEAGGQGDEHTEWTRTQLAHLYEKTGDYKTADSLYLQSLSLRPTYAFALAGLGRIAKYNKDYASAVKYYLQADSMVTDDGIKEELQQVYKITDPNKAKEITESLVDNLIANTKSKDSEDSIGHYGDKELAYAYLELNKVDKALEHALLEYNRRPNNIDVNETLAWVYYKKGDYKNANTYINVALKTKSKNPILLCRAALIYYKNGDKDLAKNTLALLSLDNPYVDVVLQNEVKQTIL